MDVKNNITLEVTKEDNKFEFKMPVGATYGCALDALFECRAYVIEQINTIQKSTDSNEEGENGSNKSD